MKFSNYFLKKNVVLIFLLFSGLISLAQKNSIEFINKETGETKFIDENKRIKIKISSGRKLTGKFRVVDDKMIRIRQNFISVDSIIMVRRRPIVLAVLSDLLIVSSASFIVMIGSEAKDNPFAVVVIPPALIIGGASLLIPNILNKNKINKWRFQIKLNDKQ
jgi:small nuclear ribonucleoprotein (snRNP)-like protein